MKVLEIFDIVGYQPVVTVFENDRYKSKLGILVGILSIASIIGLGSFLFISFILKTEINVVYNQTSSSKSTVELSSFPIIVSLTNGINNVISDDFHELRVNFWNWTQINSNYSSFRFKTPEINLEPCDSIKHFGKFKEFFETVPLYSKMKCLTNKFNYSLIGSYADLAHPYSFLNIAVNMCNNQTTGGKCPSREVLQPILQNTYLNVFYIQYNIDHGNLDEPLKPVLKGVSVPINWDIHTRYFYSIKSITHTTDTGFMFENKVDRKGYSQSSITPNVQIRHGSLLYPDLTIGTFTLTPSDMADNYNRSYLKAQVLLAQIGGIVNSILLMGKLLCYVVTKNLFVIDINNILNSDFDVFSSEDKKEIDNSNEIKRNSSQNILNSINVQRIFNTNLTGINRDKSELSGFRKPPDIVDSKIIKPSFIEVIFPMLFMRSSNSKKMKKIDLFIKKNLSFESLLQMHFDFIKFKSIFLNTNLLEFFEKSTNNLLINLKKIDRSNDHIDNTQNNKIICSMSPDHIKHHRLEKNVEL